MPICRKTWLWPTTANLAGDVVMNQNFKVFGSLVEVPLDLGLRLR